VGFIDMQLVAGSSQRRHYRSPFRNFLRSSLAFIRLPNCGAYLIRWGVADATVILMHLYCALLFFSCMALPYGYQKRYR
jgi:hypothetical protein